MSNFEIVDRRGSNKVEEIEQPEPEVQPEVAQDTRGWKVDSLRYIVRIHVVSFSGQKQQIVSGMAAAIRTDGNPFVANYYFEQEWSEGFRWEPKAKKRLDTFLGCKCSSHNPCARHRMLIPQWNQEDSQRLLQAAARPVPEVVELMMMAQEAHQAAQPHLVVPRG